MRLAPGGMNWYEIGHQDVLSLKIDQAVSPGAFSRPFRIVEASNVTGQFKQMIDGESAGNERSGGRWHTPAPMAFTSASPIARKAVSSSPIP